MRVLFPGSCCLEGEALSLSYKRLFAGSLGNGLRQGGSWGLFLYGNARLEEMAAARGWRSSYLSKCVPLAILFTTVVFPIERVKNEMQFRPPPASSGSAYAAAVRQIVAQQGVGGLYRGYVPKVGLNSILALGALWLVEAGRQK